MTLAACCIVAFYSAGAAQASSGDAATERSAFALEEVSGFVDGAGHPCPCVSQADPNVAYPAFRSDKPLYGQIRVDMEMGNNRSGTPYPFALDESGGTGTGYDRLYIDLDSDGSLSDEVSVEPLTEPPAGAQLIGQSIAQQVCFGYVTFSDKSDSSNTVETLPRLTVTEQGYGTLTFVATKARKGEIKIAQRKYGVTLVNRQPLGTHWDRPATTVKLELGRRLARVPYWTLEDRLMALHEIRGTLWKFSASSQGGQLFVEPYRGDFGTLTLGSAKGFVWNKTMTGSLVAADKALFVGNESERRSIEPVSSCRVPEGDYALELMNIRYGPLSVTVQRNDHVEDLYRGKPVLTCPLKVRKDGTCVIDFSDKAEVLFTGPARGSRIKRGDTLAVQSVLVDPKLDVMIRDLRRKPPMSLYLVAMIGMIVSIPLVLWRLGRKARPHSALLPVLCVLALLVLAGCMGALYAVDKMLHPRQAGVRGYDTLDPRVTVCRANGRTVAEGKIPFG